MSELKVHRFITTDELFPEANAGVLYYEKSEADKVIAEKDAEIAELKEQIEVLKHQACKMDCMMVKHYNEVCDDNIHHKRKRCLAMAEMCKARYDEEDARINGRGASWDYISQEMKYWERWQWHWEALAEKFKEAK